jgi:uncharacterized integral membrane protein (TIGR00697 family)
MNKIKEMLKDYRLLLRSVPGIITMFFCMSVVVMNLMANKVIVNLPHVAADGGILLAWIPFLCMDTITKRYGAKAATKLNVVALLVNLFFVAIFAIVSAIQVESGVEHVDYSSFNATFGCTWFVLVGSSVAFLVSGIINNFSNQAIGRLFIKNPDGRLAYYTRAYISTFIGQFIDNLIFATIVFIIFAPMYWGFGLTFTQCIGSALIGAVLELIMEIIFSPIGYSLSKSWKKDNVGMEYINLHSEELA